MHLILNNTCECGFNPKDRNQQLYFLRSYVDWQCNKCHFILSVSFLSKSLMAFCKHCKKTIEGAKRAFIRPIIIIKVTEKLVD